mmetsp:Transcript_111305/g.325551  ORF Transcript_111305/g.325551 Transcript_111305/m.325551 type:complete len:239 (-) Transcript_111305:100-816(-)
MANSQCGTGSWEADAAYGGRPDSESQSTNRHGHSVRRGKWTEPPQPHEVPTTRLGSGRWVTEVSSEDSQHADWSHQEYPSPHHHALQDQDQQQWACPSGHACGPPIRKLGTTVILWNLPDRCNLASVLKLWPVDGTFNYLEVPFSASEKCHKGRALFNFVSHEVAMRFVNEQNGRWVCESQTAPLEVCLARIQGLMMLLERFQGKNNQKLDDHGYLPMIFDGKKQLCTKDVLTMLFHQ